MIKFKKYLDDVNESKIVLKRRYTENHPEKNVRRGANIRNTIIEALRDKKLTLSEFKEIVSQHSKSPNKWTQRNKRFFTIEEDNVTLSKYGNKIANTLQTVNEKKVEPGKYSGLYYDTAEKVFKRERIKVGWALIDKWLQKAHDEGYLEYTAEYVRDAEKDIRAAIDKIGKKNMKMFAYESKVNEAKIKPFRKVKVGDIGQDYNGEDVTIIAVGKLGKLMKYDDTGMAEDGLSQGYLDKRDDAVAVESPDGGYAVFTYGDDGVMVAESEVNEAKINPAGYVKAGKLGYNDQFLGRRSLSYTLSVDLGMNPKHEFGGGDWLGFDHVSMYNSGGKKNGTILDDALTGKYTYDELKSAAADFLGIKESVNEGRAKATQLLKDVSKGSATEVEGIKLSKEMAGCFLEWLKSSTYGKKFSDLPFNKLFTASFNWGLDRYISKDCKPEYKELKQQAKAMKESITYTDFQTFINEKYYTLNEKTLKDYGLDRKFGAALDALPSKKFNDKDVTALAQKYNQDVGQALKYAKSAFGWLWNESNEVSKSGIVNEALKSSKLRNLLSMHKTHKSILKAIYGKTKIALDKVEDHQLQDIDPKDGQNVKGIVFYYTTQEKDNPYADPDSYYNQTFPANALLAVGTGKEFYYVSYDYRNGRGEGYSLSTSATRSFRRSNSDVGYNKQYRGWDASGLGSVKRVQAVADAAFVIDPANFGTTIDKRELRAKSREGAIAFQDDKEFRRANELRYAEILTKRASKEPIDKMVEKAIDDIADLMKAAMKNQTKNKYGEIVAGTGADGRAYRINDLTHFASKIMDDYERWASYINQAEEAEKSLKDDGGDSSYSQYSIKRYRSDAAGYAKSIKDRLKKLKKRNLAW